MTAALDIPVTKTTETKLKSTSFDKLVFGKDFTDHMLEADYENGEWKKSRASPKGSPKAWAK